MSSEVCVSVGIMDRINGHRIKPSKPDADGFYEVVVGCLGVPTRAGSFYDEESFLEQISSPTSRFNICLRDGNLSGEYDHPFLSPENNKTDIARLLHISNKDKSHYFGKVWVNQDEYIEIDGKKARPIRAKIKPCGPNGKILKEELDDPNHNTAFSMRTLCKPVTVPGSPYYHFKILQLVTFDAVPSQGFEITSKRYSGGMEGFAVSRREMQHLMEQAQGNASFCVLPEDMDHLYAGEQVQLVGSGTLGIDGNRSIRDNSGYSRSPMSLLYSKM